MDHGEDWVIADDLSSLVKKMNELVGPISHRSMRRSCAVDRGPDSQIENKFSGLSDQLHPHRTPVPGDKVVRCGSHELMDPKHGPLIAVRLSVLTRKTLGGIETDLAGAASPTTGRSCRGSTRSACRGLRWRRYAARTRWKELLAASTPGSGSASSCGTRCLRRAPERSATRGAGLTPVGRPDERCAPV